MRQRKGNQEEEVLIPNQIRTIVCVELVILSLIPILAVLAAAGISL